MFEIRNSDVRGRNEKVIRAGFNESKPPIETKGKIEARNKMRRDRIERAHLCLSKAVIRKRRGKLRNKGLKIIKRRE